MVNVSILSRRVHSVIDWSRIKNSQDHIQFRRKLAHILLTHNRLLRCSEEETKPAEEKVANEGKPLEDGEVDSEEEDENVHCPPLIAPDLPTDCTKKLEKLSHQLDQVLMKTIASGRKEGANIDLWEELVDKSPLEYEESKNKSSEKVRYTDGSGSYEYWNYDNFGSSEALQIVNFNLADLITNCSTRAVSLEICANWD